MTSPFPPSTSAPGDGRIVAARTPSGEPGLEVVAYQYPLKLIAPATGAGRGAQAGSPGAAAATTAEDGAAAAAAAARRKSALVFLLSYGGGLVAGDQVRLDVEVRAGARLSLVTQGTTKVFKASAGVGGAARTAAAAQPTRQTLTMRVAGGGAALCLLPDPVQPFADSVYEQKQVVRLESGKQAEGAAAPSLCLLDWVTQGRAARGEAWSFTSWTGRNEVWLEAPAAERDGAGPSAVHRDRLLVRDAVLLAPGYLDSSGGGLASTVLRDALHGLAVFGTLILRGPLVDALGRFFLSEFAALPRLGGRDFRSEAEAAAVAVADGPGEPDSPEAWRARRLRLEHAHGVLWSAAATRGCVVVKFGARTVEGGRLWIGAMLQREGSVEAAFGDEALMCVR